MDATHRRFETLFDSIRHRRGSWRATVAEKLRMVRLAVQEAGCGAVPTDLTRLARHLRVVKITERSLTMRGRILRSELGYEIQINEELPDTSKRDVLAHELSHLVVEDRSIGLRTGSIASAVISLPPTAPLRNYATNARSRYCCHLAGCAIGCAALDRPPRSCVTSQRLRDAVSNTQPSGYGPRHCGIADFRFGRAQGIEHLRCGPTRPRLRRSRHGLLS